MGGDLSPDSEINGAIEALQEKNEFLEVTLVGKKEILQEKLNIINSSFKNELKIVNASQVVDMNDSPTESYKNKPDSSLNVAIELEKQNSVDAIVSTGNTGANLASSMFKLGRLNGVSRPTIGSYLPTVKGNTFIIDVGASVDCKPKHLFEYAVMGSVFVKHMLGKDNPSVGLLNVGEEKLKGNELSIKAYDLLENSKLNFIGNIEGRDILKGTADIVICDGFVGNVVLKFAESIIDLLRSKLRKHSEKSIFHKVWVGLMSRTLKKILKDFDYQNHGGVPLLGINGVSIVGHGKSSALAVKNMIYRAEEMVRKNINQKIVFDLKEYLIT